jgi:branched-chain amino acid transport system permease protein
LPSSACRCWPTSTLFRAILIPFLILSLAALGLNILVGYCGQISLGTGAFMAVGAYAAYNSMRAHRRHAAARRPSCSGGVCATVVGVLFGIPSLRIKGLYLAVATLAAQFFVRLGLPAHHVVHQQLASGSVSVADLQRVRHRHRPPLREVPVLPGRRWSSSPWLAKNLVRSHIGREWMAIRDMDVAAAVIGIRPVYAKLTAFAVSSFYRRRGRRAVGLRAPGLGGSRRPSASTARSSCCSWSSSAAWAPSWAASSARPSSSSCRSS